MFFQDLTAFLTFFLALLGKLVPGKMLEIAARIDPHASCNIENYFKIVSISSFLQSGILLGLISRLWVENCCENIFVFPASGAWSIVLWLISGIIVYELFMSTFRIYFSFTIFNAFESMSFNLLVLQRSVANLQ